MGQSRAGYDMYMYTRIFRSVLLHSKTMSQLSHVLMQLYYASKTSPTRGTAHTHKMCTTATCTCTMYMRISVNHNP